MGSPPQVRGKRNASYHSARFGRITPAGAGKTLLFANFRAFQWDHPRRCGENSILLKLHVAAEGSPPQVRGKQRYFKHVPRKIRITPAGAGKTASLSRMLTAWWDHPRRCGENFIVLLAELAEMGSPPQVRGKQFSGVARG